MRNRRSLRLFEVIAATVLPITLLIMASLHGLTLSVPLLAGTFVACGIGYRAGFEWPSLENGILQGIHQSGQVIMVLFLIGAMIGGWVEAGIIPTLIFYGLQLITPHYFLASAYLLSILIAFITGSASGAMGTIGLAMLGIGCGISVPEAATAGAVISGGVAGHLLSPLSDMTAVAMSVNNGSLQTLTRKLFRVIAPVMVAALIIFTAMSSIEAPIVEEAQTAVILAEISKTFYISPLLLLPILILFGLIYIRLPLIPVLTINLMITALFALLFQETDTLSIVRSLSYGYQRPEAGPLASIFGRGGIVNFAGLVQLVILASVWSAVLQRIGAVDRIMEWVLALPILKTNIRAAAYITGLLLALMTGAIIPGIIVPSLALQKNYLNAELSLEDLSRDVLLGSFAITALVPWTNFNFFIVGILGLGAFQTAWYNYFSVMIVVFGLLATLWRPRISDAR